MKAKGISQREARRLRHENKCQQNRIDDLEGTIRVWRNWIMLPDATEIYSSSQAPLELQWSVVTAQKLTHTVIARFRDGKIVYYALPSPEQP